MTERTSEEIADFLELALKRFHEAESAERTQRSKELADLKFEAGDHWPTQLKADREAEGKPCLTIDLLSGPIRQVTNAQRNARPGIQVRPVGKGADETRAKLWQGILRQIERNSDADDVVYPHAGEYQVKMGRGFWVIRNEYADDDSFEQVIRHKWVENPHTVYADPHASEHDYRDRQYFFLTKDFTRDAFRLAFPKAQAASSQYEGAGDAPPDWLSEDRVRVAEYFYVEETTRALLALDDGTTVYEDELAQVGKRKKAPQLPEGRMEVSRRAVPRRTIKRALITATEILEENVVPGRYLPLVQVDGERRNIGGARDYRGMVRGTADPVRMLDYHESAIVEAVVAQKRQPPIVDPIAIEGFEPIWQSAPVTSYSHLPARTYDANGRELRAPFVLNQSPDIGAMVVASQRAENHLRASTGVPDVFQDERKQEQSGKAILARQAQQDLGTSNYMSSLGRAIKYAATVVMAMVPEVYDTPRILRILDVDDPRKEHQIVAFAGEDRRMEAQQLLGPDMQLFDTTQGRYDITLTIGRHTETARMEAVEGLTEVIRAFPPMAPKALPILLRNSDWEGADELARAIEPQQGQIPPEIQQRLVMLDQFAQQATERIQALQQQLDDKNLDRASKERIELAKLTNEKELAVLDAQTKLLIEEYKAKLELAQAELDARQAALARREGYAYETASAEAQAARDRAHEAAEPPEA